MGARKIGFIEAAMKYRNIVFTVAALLLIIGVWALKEMPRNEFPEFTIRQGLVVGVYPGATSAEVEEQLTKEVENYIFGYKEVKKAKTYSQSRDGIMYIFVELNDDVKDSDRFWSKLRHGLNELKASLPSGVLALVANNDFGDTAALLITLSSDTKSYKEMEQDLKRLEAECRKIPAASKIKHYGLQKEQIHVKVRPEKLNEYNIKSLSLLNAYQSNGMVNSAGVLKDGKNDLTVHFPTNFESEKDLYEQIVYSDPNGNVVRLKDIATIERKYEDPDSYIRQNGRNTILLSLEMQPGNNIVQFGKDIDKAIQTFEGYTSKDVKVEKISELPKYVDESISNFLEEFMLAIISVILVTMLLLPIRVASVAGVTVPIAVLITLGILFFVGFELDTVSLAALIVVLGMIVDNSIVVIDNHVEKLDHGMDPWKAAVKSAKELLVPIIAATLAIISAYLPLSIFLPGVSGEFVFAFPYTIAIALFVSILVAILIVPYLNYRFIKKGLLHHEHDNQTDGTDKKNAASEKKGKSMLDRLQDFFDKTLEAAFRNPKTTVGIGIGSVLLSFVLFGQVKQQLFPDMERNQLAIEVYLPTGSSLESTDAVLSSVEKTLKKDSRVTNVTSFIGTGSPRFHTVYAPNMPAHNYGQMLVNTTSNDATKELYAEYASKLADAYPNAHVKFKILSLLATKAPIEIRISGDSIADLRAAEKQVNAILAKTKNLAWVRTDWDQQQQNIHVDMDKDKANRMGYTKSLVATSLLASLNGLPLTTIWENDYPVQVKLYKDSNTPKSIKTLQDEYVTSPSTLSGVPLRAFAKLTPEWTEGTIVRRNGIRTLTVQVDVSPNVVPSDVFSEIKPQIDKLKTPNTTISYGGELESQLETYIPMAIALLVSIVMIFFILLFQFKKIKLSLLIMSTMLLGLPGAAIGLYVMHFPFGMTAFMGVTSLCGIVVRNGIILVDYAHELAEKNGYSIYEAALAAGKRRMRPIFLTSAAASVGVISMIASRSPLWGPLGTVICFGLMISMVLTLFILPVVYWLVYRKESTPSSNATIPASTLIIIGMMLAPAMGNAQAAKSAAVSAPIQRHLTLDSCKAIAINNSKTLKQSQQEVLESIEQSKSAFTSYFPVVNATLVAMRAPDYLIKTPATNLPVYDGNPANLAAPTQFTYVPGFNVLDKANVAIVRATQPIYAGGRIVNGNKLASLGKEVSLKQKEMSTTEVLVKTEELFWTIIALQEKMKTVEKYQGFLDTLSRDVANMCKAGLTQRNDLLKVQIKQNELQMNRLKLQNAINLSKMALNQQIGLPNETPIALDCALNQKPTMPQLANKQQATANRVEYQLVGKMVEAEKLQKKMIMGDYLPQLALSAEWDYFDINNSSTKQTFAMVSLSIPISDWWGGSKKIKQQQFKIQRSQLKLEETAEKLELQMSQSQNEVTESVSQIQLSEKMVQQSTENFKISNDNYKSGVIGISDLLEAQALLQQTQNELSEKMCNHQIVISKYQQAFGIYK
ncbi:efflux RND transporter permease subunit [uncultured Acetobacteroides sp.]|uniref:efflux RND transporter permease subunit n=1 Tax=uncultured Acetobacteroides sp. TaxID=1760811 RepID=UPI0029F50B27|nr:efflux RND transporter permease subunit [uncultured Acetobacteroides sp.]